MGPGARRKVCPEVGHAGRENGGLGDVDSGKGGR